MVKKKKCGLAKTARAPWDGKKKGGAFSPYLYMEWLARVEGEVFHSQISSLKLPKSIKKGL